MYVSESLHVVQTPMCHSLKRMLARIRRSRLQCKWQEHEEAVAWFSNKVLLAKWIFFSARHVILTPLALTISLCTFSSEPVVVTGDGLPLGLPPVPLGWTVEDGASVTFAFFVGPSVGTVGPVVLVLWAVVEFWTCPGGVILSTTNAVVASVLVLVALVIELDVVTSAWVVGIPCGVGDAVDPPVERESKL